MPIKIENNFPVLAVSRMAKAEAANRQHYRPVYSIHKYWARRLGTIFRTIGICLFSGARGNDILRLTADGNIDPSSLFFQSHDFSDKIVVDPFMGGGTTIVELLRLKSRCLGIDSNPIAFWTTRQQLIPRNIDKCYSIFHSLERNFKSSLGKFYSIKCPKGDHLATVVYFFWVKKVTCRNCGEEKKLFKYHVLSRNYKQSEASKNHVFCPDCGTITVLPGKLPESYQCSVCNELIPVMKGCYSRGKYKCDCGFSEPLIKAVREIDAPLPQELFAIEYYCPQCKERGYRKTTEKDIQTWEEARDSFNKQKKLLIYPRNKIPDGDKTKALLNYKLNNWYQLFNERQLLSLTLLLSEILNIEDLNSRDFFLTIFSKMLEYQNMLCQYNYGAMKIVNSFNHHAYPITTIPVENNPWGTEIGAGTFSSCFRAGIKALQYIDSPFEKVKNNKELINIYIKKESIRATFAENRNDFFSSEVKNCFLECGDSRNIHLPENSVDAVITDPPYYDNVMYSELADFFHSWLHLGLNERFAAFNNQAIAIDREIIKNRTRKIDNYAKGIETVFQNCYDYLKDNGALVFTFHHKKDQAYSALLSGLVNSRFTITATFPVIAEPAYNAHLKNTKSPVLDTVFICRKKQGELSITIENLIGEIRREFRNESVEFLHEGLIVRHDDWLSFARCKIIEKYSRYFPNIYKNNGQLLEIDELLPLARSLIKKT
ncbi:MAG: hypothetical protein ACTSP4_02735 [Candidatus Hodarchaeales archaeon]